MPRQGAPAKIDPQKTADYLEVLTKAVFQSGISWRVIEAKWAGFQEAFFGFDPKKISRLSERDVDRLIEDTRIVRNRRKIEATIDNATEMVALEKEFGSIGAYLASHRGFDETVADLRKRFRFVGETGAYFFLHVVGRPVPSHDEWQRRRS
jgi:3-methyladenine DNA glycosylase Tag